MKSYKFVIGILCILCLSVACFCAELNETTNIFYQDVPDQITTEVTKYIQDISIKDILTDADRDSIIASIESYDAKRGENEQQRELIRKMGRSSIIVIADLLMDKENDTRQKGLYALGCLIRPIDEFDEDYVRKLEPVLISLCRRSQYDADTTIRIHALALLRGIGSQNKTNIPEGVINGLDKALNDPDAHVRKMARRFKVSLGLAPRDSSDIHI